MCDTPADSQTVTASFREEHGNAPDQLTLHARNSDLVVMGRARQKQGLAPDTLEDLVLHCGRPVLVAPSAAPPTLTDTVMVCWEDRDNAARAVSAAVPIVAKAKRVAFVSVGKRSDDRTASADELARRFGWEGVVIETRVIAANGRQTADAVASAADEYNADLVVMGAYGRSRIRTLLFGSRTDAVLSACDRAVLLMH